MQIACKESFTYILIPDVSPKIEACSGGVGRDRLYWVEQWLSFLDSGTDGGFYSRSTPGTVEEIVEIVSYELRDSVNY